MLNTLARSAAEAGGLSIASRRAAAAVAPAAAAAEGARLRMAHGVRPGTSWGTLTLAGQRKWVSLNCDRAEPGLGRQRTAEEEYVRGFGDRLRTALRSRPAERRVVRADAIPPPAAAARPGN